MTPFKAKYGPWALIAGGSSGLGAAFAEALADRGINLILVARNLGKLESLSQRLTEKYPVKIEIFQMDLSDFAAVKNFLNDVKFPIGLLIYNAAYAPIGYFDDVAEDDLKRIVDVNIKTPLLLSKLLSKSMISQKRGGIILMSSLAGGQGSPKIATYAASKAFNTILAEGLWKELEKYNIDVLSCMAGAISTPGYEQAKGKKAAPGTLTPEKVAEAALAGLGKGPTTIPGLTNKLATFFMKRIFPGKWAISIMNKNTKDLT